MSGHRRASAVSHWQSAGTCRGALAIRDRLRACRGGVTATGRRGPACRARRTDPWGQPDLPHHRSHAPPYTRWRAQRFNGEILWPPQPTRAGVHLSPSHGRRHRARGDWSIRDQSIRGEHHSGASIKPRPPGHRAWMTRANRVMHTGGSNTDRRVPSTLIRAEHPACALVVRNLAVAEAGGCAETSNTRRGGAIGAEDGAVERCCDRPWPTESALHGQHVGPCSQSGSDVVPGTPARSGQSLRMARRAVRLQAQVRSAAAMLVAPFMRRRLIAVLRSVAITRGALPLLLVDASSRR